MDKKKSKRKVCPFLPDCKIVAYGDFEQSKERQFYRHVFCETHQLEFSETLRVVGYFVIEEDGHEGEFLHGVVKQKEER